VLGHVQLRVHILRDWLDVRLQLLLDAAQIVAVLERDQVDGNSQMAEAARAENNNENMNESEP